MTEVRTAYLYAGLPAAGKTTAREIGQEYAGGMTLSSSDMIRQMAADDGFENPDSEELAQYAANLRDELGPAFFADKTINLVLQGKVNPDYPVHIDGPRHAKAIRRFREFFDLVALIYVEAPQDVRLKRIQNRDRDGEGGWGIEHLAQRDEVELKSLGQETILESEQINYRVENSTTLDSLRAQMADVVESVEKQERAILKHSND